MSRVTRPWTRHDPTRLPRHKRIPVYADAHAGFKPPELQTGALLPVLLSAIIETMASPPTHGEPSADPPSSGSKPGPKPGSPRNPVDSIDYRLIFQRSPDAIFVWDSEGQCLDANEAACDLSGYSKGQLTRMSVQDLLHPKNGTHAGGCAEALRQAVPSSFTCFLKRKDGTEMSIELSLCADPGDKPGIYSAIIRDRTEHNEVLHRLNDALQRMTFHVQRMPLAHIVWDLDFKVIEWNPAAQHMFGYTAEEAMGKHAYDLIVPTDIVEIVSPVWRDLLQGDTASHLINVTHHKDGSRMTCEWFNTPLLDSAGNIYAVASMAMDVSQRQAMQGRILEAQKLESLGVLASGVAHDFNSLLTVMLGRAALMRSVDDLPEEAEEHLDIIEEAGFHADDLIKHLLAYARTGRHNPQPTDFNLAVQDALRLVTPSLGKGHPLDTDIAHDLPLVIADRSQIEQVVMNLCLNAREAMPDNGTIQVTTSNTTLTTPQSARCIPHDMKPGNYVELTVTDTGSGMDEHTIARAFDPFYTTKTTGHGLGLAAVLGILRQHSGGVRVDSKTGKGTTMHVYIPIDNDTAPDDAPSQ